MSLQPYLAAMDIQTWQLKPTSSSSHQDWEALQQAVRTCTACALHKTRTQTVFGVGNTKTKLMFIGEAPGFYEDQKGEPFVGAAGRLLNAMLQSVGFAREQIFIANILKCRPPNNRDPAVEEVKQCTPFLEKQIAWIQPTLLVALGRIAAHYLLNCKTPLGQLRGKTYSFNNTPLLVTYHPAYLLRNPSDKRKAYDDMRIMQAMVQADPTAPV